MQLPISSTSSLTHLPVLISGEWDRVAPKWLGTARASEALVAVLFLTARGETEWCKSERGRAPELDLRLDLFPFEDPRLVQVNATAGGGGRRFATRVTSPTYRPAVPSQTTVSTGGIFQLTLVQGDPEIHISILLVATGDVTVGRKGLWQVRPTVADQLDQPLRGILSRGRTGRFRP